MIRTEQHDAFQVVTIEECWEILVLRRGLRLHVGDSLEQLIDDGAATLAADFLDLLQLDLRRLVCLLLGLLVAAGVL